MRIPKASLPTEEAMQISTRSLSVLVLVLLAAACGSASNPDNMPAANGGGVPGTGMGGSPDKRGAGPSSSAAPTTETAGGFVLNRRPERAAGPQINRGGPKANPAEGAP